MSLKHTDRNAQQYVIDTHGRQGTWYSMSLTQTERDVQVHNRQSRDYRQNGQPSDTNGHRASDRTGQTEFYKVDSSREVKTIYAAERYCTRKRGDTGL